MKNWKLDRCVAWIGYLPLFLVIGCHSSSDTLRDPSKLNSLEFDTSHLVKEEQDINGDGVPDQLIYKNSKDVVQYAKRDFNFDGVTDLTEYYDAQGQHTRDEIDLDYDGIVDVIITYKDNAIVKKEYSVDFQGNRHGVQYFNEKGALIEIRRDTDGDGNLDVIEFYHPGEKEPYQKVSMGDGNGGSAVAVVDEEPQPAAGMETGSDEAVDKGHEGLMEKEDVGEREVVSQ